MPRANPEKNKHANVDPQLLDEQDQLFQKSFERNKTSQSSKPGRSAKNFQQPDDCDVVVSFDEATGFGIKAGGDLVYPTRGYSRPGPEAYYRINNHHAKCWLKWVCEECGNIQLLPSPLHKYVPACEWDTTHRTFRKHTRRRLQYSTD